MHVVWEVGSLCVQHYCYYFCLSCNTWERKMEGVINSKLLSPSFLEAFLLENKARKLIFLT